MLETRDLDLCSISGYYKDENGTEKLGRIPSSTEDIEIIGAITGNRILRLNELADCGLNSISSINLIFLDRYAGLFITSSDYFGIPINAGSEDSWISHHGTYDAEAVTSGNTIENISTNTFIYLSGAGFNSSYLSARQIILKGGIVNGPFILCNTLELKSTANDIVALNSADIECSKLIANIPKARIDQSTIVADKEYKHISGDISVLASTIISPEISIGEGYLLDSLINFDHLTINSGYISSRCIYDETLGSGGIAEINGGFTDPGFFLESPNLSINSSGWIQGTINVKSTYGSSIFLGFYGKMKTEHITISTINNAGNMFIDNASVGSIYNTNSGQLTINEISNGNIRLYNLGNGAECIFNSSGLNLEYLQNHSRIKCNALNIEASFYASNSMNAGLIEATTINITGIDNVSGIIKSTSNISMTKSTNNGTIVATRCELVDSKNYAFIEGGPVLFYNSENHGTGYINYAIFDYKPSGSDKQPKNFGLLNNGSFYSGSANFGSGNNINFYDISSNNSIVSGHKEIKFFDNSTNSGTIINNVRFYDETQNFGTVVSGSFYDDSRNKQIANNFNFYNHTINDGAAFVCSFYNFSTSSSSGDSLSCRFLDKSQNFGSAESGNFYNFSRNVSEDNDVGHASFFDNSINSGHAVVFPVFNNNSINLGTVYGALFDNTINSGICLGSQSLNTYTNVFTGNKAANLWQCNYGKVYFGGGATNGKLTTEEFFTPGNKVNIIDSQAVVSSTDTASFVQGSKNLGTITNSQDSTLCKVEFRDNSQNLGNINNCHEVKFINSMNGPPLLGYQGTHPWYYYTNTNNCSSIVFEQNSTNKQSLLYCENIVFDNSNNEATIYAATHVTFASGSINKASNVTSDFISFINTSNNLGGTIASIVTEFTNSSNSIDIESPSILFENSINNAMVKGTQQNFRFSRNLGQILGGQLTFDHSDNVGIISGTLSTSFTNSRNLSEGTIIGESAYYYEDNDPVPKISNPILFDSSINEGTISGAYVRFISHSVNRGIVIGEAEFDASSTNLGIVSGDLGFLQQT